MTHRCWFSWPPLSIARRSIETSPWHSMSHPSFNFALKGVQSARHEVVRSWQASALGLSSTITSWLTGTSRSPRNAPAVLRWALAAFLRPWQPELNGDWPSTAYLAPWAARRALQTIESLWSINGCIDTFCQYSPYTRGAEPSRIMSRMQESVFYPCRGPFKWPVAGMECAGT